MADRREPLSPQLAAVALATVLIAGSAGATQRSSGHAPVAGAAQDRLEQDLRRALRQSPPIEGVPEPLACAERLAKIARYAPEPNRAGPGQCGSSDLVRLDHVVLTNGMRVALEPPATLRCAMAEALARWLRDEVATAATELGAPLATLTVSASYDCRTRNNGAGTKLSEHARGNALDVSAVRLRNGGVFALADPRVSKPFREQVRAAACDRFTTVLGPGSDRYHESHVHLDLAARNGGYRICQWEVRESLPIAEVPLPRKRPDVPGEGHRL